jgi:predicted  nucleic acid-binding Zn-ribbon protein
VSSLTPDVLLVYVQNKAISDAGRLQLQQILDVKRQIADVDNQIRQTQRDIESVTSDENRTRQNIQSLNQVSGQQEQVQKYARQLADQESQLAALRDRQAGLTKQKSTLDASLNDLIGKLQF